jgi:pyruvate/2-oxoacid:ferredoxin oxidoreductase alpha subunit
MGGITYPEVVASLYTRKDRPEKILSVIGGLGGKDMDDQDFMAIIEHLDGPDERTPLYLYGEKDVSDFNRLQQIAKWKGALP